MLIFPDPPNNVDEDLLVSRRSFFFTRQGESGRILQRVSNGVYLVRFDDGDDGDRASLFSAEKMLDWGFEFCPSRAERDAVLKNRI